MMNFFNVKKKTRVQILFITKIIIIRVAGIAGASLDLNRPKRISSRNLPHPHPCHSTKEERQETHSCRPKDLVAQKEEYY